MYTYLFNNCFYRDTKKARYTSNNSLNNEQLINVPFNIEKDGRKNFPDNQTFQDFKKQKDLFYEMFRQHRDDISGNDENFRTSVTKLCYSVQENKKNLRHFAELFKEQLLLQGLDELNNGQDGIDIENELKVLSNLKKTNPKKFCELQKRLIRPSQYDGGPSPCPNFSGRQKFFKDFICYSTYPFVFHLKKVLIKSIKVMDKAEFDLEDEIPVNEIGNLILKLKIMAKFLAMIEVLPYSKNSQISWALDELDELDGIDVENELKVLDLRNYIDEALKKHRLVISLPWIIEYCSIMSSIISKLPYYQEVFVTLVAIYKSMFFKQEKFQNQLVLPILETNSDVEEINSPMKKISIKDDVKQHDSKKNYNFNRFFLCIHLGWLFENPSFPRELFVRDIPKLIGDISAKVDSNTIDGNKCLKATLLYNCCPYLSELKVVLSQYHTGIKSRRTALSSNPATKKETRENVTRQATIEPQQMQQDLEVHFFHQQPDSVKQTVDFVTKRLTSNIVSMLKDDVIPKDARSVLNEIDENLKMLVSDKSSTKERNDSKEMLYIFVKELAEKSHNEIIKEATKIVEKQLEKEAAYALISLLGRTKQNVISLCQQFIDRRVKEHTKKWTNENASKEYFSNVYQKEFEKLWNAHTKALDSPSVFIKQSAVINENLKIEEVDIELVMPLCQILIQLKNDIAKMVVDKVAVEYTSETLYEFIERIELSYAYAYLEAAPDDKSLIDGNVKGFENLSFEWILMLFIFHPELMTPDVQEKIVGLWSGKIPNQIKHYFNLGMFSYKMLIKTIFGRKSRKFENSSIDFSRRIFNCLCYWLFGIKLLILNPHYFKND